MILEVSTEEGRRWQEVEAERGAAGAVGAAVVEQGRAGGADRATAGISEQTLYRWRDEFIGGGKQALNGRGENEQAKKIARLQGQLAERDQVIGEITIANRILKKLSGGLS